MTCQIVDGARTWSAARSREGHRTYKLKVLVRCDTTDGPANALQTPGLPEPGSAWNVDNDSDPWATCKLDVTVTPMATNEPNTGFELEFTFSTEPEGKACQNEQIEDPLLQPPKISGGFTKHAEEATTDRFGLPINNSAHEQIRGPQVEFESTRQTVKIEMNVAQVDQALLQALVMCLNSTVLWGCPPRTVQLSNAQWERKYHGQCAYYYSLSMELEARPEGFDKDLLDEGSKVLNGRWGSDGHWVNLPVDAAGGVSPNYKNPAHFIRFKDRNGENAKVILDGKGNPYEPPLTVISCAQCATGAPEIWIVAGFTVLNEEPETGFAADPSEEELLLAHTTGCTWDSGTFQLPDEPDLRVTLQYVAGQWEITAPPFTGVWHLTPGTVWSCTGPNHFKQVLANGTGPRYLTIYNDAQPGTIHVEKYPEADLLLLLGLPAVL